MILGVVLATALSLAAQASTAQTDIIDRVLAVIDGKVITLSDVRGALTLGLVPADVSDDPDRAVLRRLIDRRLMLAEVERYAPPEPPQTVVDARVADLEARFKDAPAFEAALNQSAMSRDELRRYVRDSLRIENYLQQRFSSAAEPSEDDVALYYKNHPSRFTVNGVVRPFSEVREDVRTRVADERRVSAIRDWLEALRRRSSIVELHSPPR